MKRLQQVIALLGSVLSALFTLNGYRPPSKRGYPSLYAFSYGVFAFELPVEILAGQAAVPFYGVYDFTRSDASMHPLMVPMLEQYVLKQSRRRYPDADR